MKMSNWMLIGLTTAMLAGCGTEEGSNNTTANNTTANNTTPANNTTANNTTPANNTTANNTTPANNTTANNTTPTNNGTPLTCTGDFGAAQACGGDPKGSWTVTEGCTNFDYEAQIQGACASMVVDDAVVTLAGTLTVDAATFAQDVNGTISLTMNTPDKCGVGNCSFVQSGLGAVATTATCVDAGAGCDCTASIDFASASDGAYTTAGGVATLGSGETYYYCASGGTMLLREFGTNADDAQPSVLYSL